MQIEYQAAIQILFNMERHLSSVDGAVVGEPNINRHVDLYVVIRMYVVVIVVGKEVAASR